MKFTAFAAATLLLSGLGLAEEVLVLTNGTRMTVQSYEVKETVVVITTLDGKLRSLPRSLVDLEATDRAPASAPTGAPAEKRREIALPDKREERVRWALEHYGPKGLLNALLEGFDQGLGKNGESLPPGIGPRLQAAFKEPFSIDRIFGDATEEFLRQAAAGDVDAWLLWLDSPSTRKVLDAERWEEEIRAAANNGAPNAKVLPSVKRTPRSALVERLDTAADFPGGWHDMLGSAFGKLLESYRANAPAVAQAAMDAADPRSIPLGKRDDMRAEMRAYLESAYGSVTTAELEGYVRFWESPSGRGISAAMKNALVTAFGNAGMRSGREMATVFHELFPGNDAAIGPTPSVSRFDELHFQFTPRQGWAPFDVKRFGPYAVLGLLRSNPRVVFMIVTEHVPGAGDFSSADAASVIRAGLQTSVEGYRSVVEEPRTFNGMDGIFMVSEARILKQDARYLHWVYTRGEFIYQLVVWGFNADVDLEGLKKEASEMYSGFELLEDAPPVASSSNLLTDYRSDEYGYGMQLQDSGWKRWEGIEEQSPDADHAGLRDSAGFVVVPVHLGSLAPSMEALSKALLTRLDIDYSTLAPGSVRPIDAGGYRGVTMDFRRTINETPFIYRLNVYRTDHFGYLVAVWTGGKDERVLEDLQARFHVEPAHDLPKGRNFEEKQELAQALILNEIGLDYYARAQYGTGSEYFGRAAELAPNDPAMLTNLMSTLSTTGRFEEALKVLEERLPRFPDHLDLQSYRPFLLARLGRQEEAVGPYEALFAKGYQNDDDLHVYAEMLWEMGRKESALSEVEAYRATRDSIPASRLAARLYGRMENHDREIAILLEKHNAFPAEAGLGLDLLDAYLDAERGSEAAALAAKLIAKGEPTAELHVRKGRAELALGRHAEAKASFQAALDLDPTDDAAGEYLRHVSGMMGQGNQESVRHPLKPVAIPELLASVPPPLPSPVEQGAYYQNRVTAISFVPGEDYRRTERYVVRVTDAKAVPAFSSFEFEFDPLNERLYVNELRVLDDEGKLVAEGDRASYYVTDDTSEGMATEDQILTVPVPGLVAGHRIELTVTWQRVHPPGNLPFLRHTFSSGYPVQRGSLYLAGRIDAVRYHGEKIAPQIVSDGSIYWIAETPPVYRAEGFEESIERYLPFVWMGDRGESWEEIGRMYLGDIRERLAPDPEIRKLAESLVGGLPGREQKIRSIAEYVQKSYTYKAIEFGRRAWLPNPTAQIIRNKYGDCKDHALLFYALLRAIDEPADLVLVSSSSEIQTAVPSLDQFDHMIVYSQDYRGGHFFDLTDKDHDVAALPPIGLGGKAALMLDPARPRLVEIPDYPGDSSRIRSERSVAAREKDLVVDEILTVEGYYAAWIRAALKNGDSTSRRQQIQRYMESGGTAFVEELEAENLSEPGRPLVLRVRYRIDAALHQADERLVGRIPAVWERTFLDMASPGERLTPYRVAYPLSMESQIRVIAPDGYRFATAPVTPEEGTSVYASWKVSSELSPDSLVVRSRSVRPSRRGPPAEYREIAETITEFLDATQPSLVLVRTDPKAARARPRDDVR